jgi:DNA-binding MarR family transcriptional regulator
MLLARTPGSAELTELILDLFRLNGQLLAAGDALVADLGLTSARWQVLGAVSMAPQPEPVAALARRMGLTRQAVQRVTNDLAALDLVEFRPNPAHQRAQLVVLTAAGERVYAEAERRQIPWANRLSEHLDPAQITAAGRVVRALAARLE